MTNIIKQLATKKDPTLGSNKQRQDAVQRINVLETAYAKLVQTLEQSFTAVVKDTQQLSSGIQTLDSVVRAILEVQGEDFSKKVTERVKANHIADLEKQSEADQANIKIAVAEARLIETDTVENDDDIVLLSQQDAEGQQKYPIKRAVEVRQLQPAVKELVKGRKVGETVTLPDGGTVVIVEAYKVLSGLDENPDDESPQDQPLVEV